MLKEAGFRRLLSDPQMYVHEETGAIIVAHVDDLMITAPEDVLPKVQEQPDKAFKVKWGATLGPTWAKFLGKEWRRRGDEIDVRIPEKYYIAVLKEHGLEKCRSLATPCVAQRNDSDDKPLEEDRRHRFRRTVGRLMWVAPERPDLSFSVKEMARRVQAPTEGDWGTLKRILRYIRGTMTAELHLKLNVDMSDDEVLAVTDASWASLADRRSTSGGTLWLGRMLIAHWSRTQPVVTQSSCEAELTALNSGATEAKLIQSVLEELGMKVKIRVQSDSSSAVMVTAKRGLGRLRHIQVRQLWLQEETRAERITLEHITSPTCSPRRCPRQGSTTSRSSWGWR